MSQLWDRLPIASEAISVVVLLEQGSDRQQLLQLCNELQSVLKQHGKAYEIIIPVASASEQHLADPSQYPSVRYVVDEEVQEGVGAALKAGIAAAKNPLVFVLPMGYSPSVLPEFLKEIDQVDVVCGVRDGNVRGRKWRQFFSVAYQIFGLSMQDPECPVRLYRKEMFQRIPIQSKGAFAQIEILAKANFQSMVMTEVPVVGPATATHAAKNKKDFWKVLNNPQFGPPPEKVVEKSVKPIIQTQAPEVRS